MSRMLFHVLRGVGYSVLCGAILTFVACKPDVPDVTGISQAEAEKALAAVPLQVGEISSRCHDEVPPGCVITQKPAGRIRVQKDSAVDLEISTGPCPVITAVPDLSGMSRTKAETAITSAGLSLGSVNTACSDATAVNLVASQNPAAGTTVTGGSVVNFTLSSGPCPVITTVPDLSGMSQTEAENAITAAGLSVGSVNAACSDSAPTGTVIHQSPAAASQVAASTTVNLDLAAGPCISVPDLSGMDVADATTALLGLNLAPSLEMECDNAVPANAVAAQYPAAGTQVLQASIVYLTVSTGSCPVIIPNLLNLSEQDASDLLMALGLTVGSVNRSCNDGFPEGAVFSQTPGPGSIAIPGTQVNINVSSGPCPVSVPNLAGMTRSDAENALTAAGLVPDYPFYTCSLIFPPDHVAQQNPAAGTSVLPGTTIYFGLATGGCDDPITIADTRLNEILRELYNITDPATPLIRQQLLGLVSLDIPGEGITSLSGLETARNLQSLNASNNLIADVSPLAGLDILRHLDIEHNQVTDLSPLALGTTFSKPSELFPRELACTGNPLSSDSINIYIPQLIARGVDVTYVLKNLR